ncbi:MAG: efflux RND transporter periplasmic adaptor subunit [Candidatus Omnitrophica bacterium]|nr:efflux RND transporter periplasmic adaptor subunit [Candidatus Omnitrophota bacterium]
MKINIKPNFRVRVAAGLVIVICLAGIAFMQYRLKEKIFKKPAPREKRIAAKEEAIPQEPVLVKVYKAQMRNFEDALPLMGTIKGFKEIDLKFETSGIVDSFNFKEGERAEEGEIIATLNQRDALLKLKYNEIELDKIQKLYDMGAVGKPKLDQTKLELESAKRELDKTYLYATKDGVVGTKDAEIGEYVTSSDKITTLIDDKDVFVDLGVVEKDIGKVRIGQKGVLTVDTYPDANFEGVVYSVSPVVEGKSRTQSARLKVKNQKGMLLAGMFARATVSVYSAQDVIILPNAALDKTDDGYVTYVFKNSGTPPKEEGADQAQEGVVEARPIEAAYRSSDFFVVKSGLEGGELVVVETQEKLKDEFKVIVTEIQEAIF